MLRLLRITIAESSDKNEILKIRITIFSANRQDTENIRFRTRVTCRVGRTQHYCYWRHSCPVHIARCIYRIGPRRLSSEVVSPPAAWFAKTCVTEHADRSPMTTMMWLARPRFRGYIRSNPRQISRSKPRSPSFALGPIVTAIPLPVASFIPQCDYFINCFIAVILRQLPVVLN